MVVLGYKHALPPALTEYIQRKADSGAAVHQLVPLNTKVPVRGPYVMDHGGRFTLTLYGGELLKYQANPALGRLLDITA